jgi:hypothetical protein
VWPRAPGPAFSGVASGASLISIWSASSRGRAHRVTRTGCGWCESCHGGGRSARYAVNGQACVGARGRASRRPPPRLAHIEASTAAGARVSVTVVGARSARTVSPS